MTPNLGMRKKSHVRGHFDETPRELPERGVQEPCLAEPHVLVSIEAASDNDIQRATCSKSTSFSILRSLENAETRRFN